MKSLHQHVSNVPPAQPTLQRPPALVIARRVIFTCNVIIAHSDVTLFTLVFSLSSLTSLTPRLALTLLAGLTFAASVFLFRLDDVTIVLGDVTDDVREADDAWAVRGSCDVFVVGVHAFRAIRYPALNLGEAYWV